MSTTTFSLPRRVRGVTLIEVLVALVIIAVGLLGLAGLQVRGLSIQKDAHGRAIATQLALDLADRMRANRDPVTAAPPAQYAFTAGYGGAAPVAGTDCSLAVCDLAQQAQFDLAGWVSRIAVALPGGWANVQPVPGTEGRVWDVTLMWAETGFRARGLLGGLPCVTGRTEVECMTIRVRP